MKYNDALIEARLLVDEYLEERRGGRSKPKLIKQKRSKDSGKDVISKETAQDQRMKGLWKDFKDMKDRGEILCHLFINEYNLIEQIIHISFTIASITLFIASNNKGIVAYRIIPIRHHESTLDVIPSQ